MIKKNIIPAEAGIQTEAWIWIPTPRLNHAGTGSVGMAGKWEHFQVKRHEPRARKVSRKRRSSESGNPEMVKKNIIPAEAGIQK